MPRHNRPRTRIRPYKVWFTNAIGQRKSMTVYAGYPSSAAKKARKEHAKNQLSTLPSTEIYDVHVDEKEPT